MTYHILVEGDPAYDDIDFLDRLLESDRLISGGQVLEVTVRANGVLGQITRDVIVARGPEGVAEGDWRGRFDQTHTLLLGPNPSPPSTAGRRNLIHRKKRSISD